MNTQQQDGWQPISIYDALAIKPKYALFLFPAIQAEGCTLPEEVKTMRELALRECTHWHPIQDPSNILAKEIPHSQNKQLTERQIAALSLLAKGKANFHAAIKAGANLSTMSALVKMGLAAAVQDGGMKQWEITDFGMTVLQANRNAESGLM